MIPEHHDPQAVLGDRPRLSAPGHPRPQDREIELDRRRAAPAPLLAAVVIDGRQRLITVPVDGADWEIASRSMTERVLLRCEGELRRVGSAYVLEHPRGLRLVGEA